MNIVKKLEELTGKKGWKIISGPETRCGVDYYFKRNSQTAYVNEDQGFVTISVDGENIFGGFLE